MKTVTGWCMNRLHDGCDGAIRSGPDATGWNWWCTCACHPEPVIDLPEHQPALDFWRKHRAMIEEQP